MIAEVGVMRRIRDRRAPRGRTRTVSSALQDEISGEPWMCGWELTPSVTTPSSARTSPSVHRTREEMIEPIVSKALAGAARNPVRSISDATRPALASVAGMGRRHRRRDRQP
jgi:hypothetical protein